MLKNNNEPFFLNKKAVYVSALIVLFFATSFAQKKVNFNFAGVVFNEVTEKPISGAKVELIKNNQVIQSIITESSGKYKMTWDINQVDSNDANYTVNYSSDNMISKSAKINTFIRRTLVSSYNFNLEVFMTPTSEGDIIIDLPSAKIKWDVKSLKFSVDQKYANIIKEIKKQEDPKKVQELIAQQKREEEALKRKEEDEKRAKEEAERRAAAESMKKNMEAIRKQQEELDRLAALQKAKEDSANQATADALKKTMSALKQQVAEIKKQEAAAPAPVAEVVVPEPEPVKPEPVSEDEDEFSIKEIYSIRDVKALRARSFVLSKELQKRKIKNWSSKYETENPLTSLLDEIDKYEKSAKKSNNK